jgi:hypothetical protein
MKGRTTVLSTVAALTLGVAGFAAAHGRPPDSHGKPSTTPPPWSHGHHGHDKGGEHGRGHDGEHGRGHDQGHPPGHGH